jgi:hypothetical protein
MNGRDQKVQGCSCVISTVTPFRRIRLKEPRPKTSKDEQKKQGYREATAARARLLKELPLTGGINAAGL